MNAKSVTIIGDRFALAVSLLNPSKPGDSTSGQLGMSSR